MEDVMNDRPQAEACALEPAVSADTNMLVEESGSPMLHERVAEILPRLITMSTTVALIAPALLPIYGLDSFGGGGIRGC
jgi:hypothetical protein